MKRKDEKPIKKKLKIVKYPNKNTYNEHKNKILVCKNFISELQKVQHSYFKKLVSELGLNIVGESLLSDYIYNFGDEDSYDFQSYLNDIRLDFNYCELVKEK